MTVAPQLAALRRDSHGRADGVSGRVRISPDKLTGVLAPLRDQRFFERVFIDQGAVAWPGEIDLAPDAMYEEVVKHTVGGR
jgi:hypothetical protein